MRIAGALGTLLIAATALQAQGAKEAPVCQAERRGQSLITRIEYPDGYRVEGPWRVTSSVRAGSTSTVRAVLDRIVELRPFTSSWRTTALPSAIEMTFTGSTVAEVLDEAATIWCQTVAKARNPHQPRAPNRDALAEKRVVM